MPGLEGKHPEVSLVTELLPRIQHSQEVYFDPESYRENQFYLYGVDCFNSSYWWESHEVWEHVWNEAGRKTQFASFVQALIQIAAAHIKNIQGDVRSMNLLKARALNKLEVFSHEDFYAGIRLQDLMIWLQEDAFQDLKIELI